jgi:hypothetical protein
MKYTSAVPNRVAISVFTHAITTGCWRIGVASVVLLSAINLGGCVAGTGRGIDGDSDAAVDYENEAGTEGGLDPDARPKADSGPATPDSSVSEAGRVDGGAAPTDAGLAETGLVVVGDR